MKRLSAVLCVLSFAAFAGAPSPQPTSSAKEEPKPAAVLRGSSSSPLGTTSTGSLGTQGLGTQGLGTRGSSTKAPKPSPSK